MEVIKSNTKVAMEAIGEARNWNKKQNGCESRFASSDETVTDHLKLSVKKNKNRTKSPQTLLNVWEKWANERMKIFYTEVRTKDGFFYNFVENIVNKKSHDPSCILWYLVTRDAF